MLENHPNASTNIDRNSIIEDGRIKIALAEYGEILTQFRKLTDIRFKLLTYLPVGTAAAAVLSQTNDSAKQGAISAFALVVTLCIATYDKRNDQHYDELVSRAAELERDLHIEHGSFSDRPMSWLKYGFIKVEHRWPISWIYMAAASLWAYLFTAALVKDHPSLMRLPPAAPAVVFLCWRVLHWIEAARSAKLREAVYSLMGRLVGSHDEDVQNILVSAIAERPILGIGTAVATRRVAHHWKEYKPRGDPRAASLLLSRVIDLPGRWIEDVWTGRR